MTRAAATTAGAFLFGALVFALAPLPALWREALALASAGLWLALAGRARTLGRRAASGVAPHAEARRATA